VAIGQEKDDEAFPRGALPTGCVHVCVDMQRLFAEATEWHTPWMNRILPNVLAIAQGHAADTIFTRFVPAARVGEGEGAWRAYYERWASMTLERLGADMVELMAPLAALVPPAEVIDKRTYSPWIEPDLLRRLRERRAEALVVTGGETDVCVLATVLGAVDYGFRVIIVTDALCSASDDTHDALLQVYRERYNLQVETATTEALLRAWG
jgi:nicotinamidase-related amidase